VQRVIIIPPRISNIITSWLVFYLSCFAIDRDVVINYTLALVLAFINTFLHLVVSADGNAHTTMPRFLLPTKSSIVKGLGIVMWALPSPRSAAVPTSSQKSYNSVYNNKLYRTRVSIHGDQLAAGVVWYKVVWCGVR
jgi:hypothetical protein